MAFVFGSWFLVVCHNVLRFIHDVINDNISFLSKMESYSKVDVCYIYFIHWSVNRHLVVSTVLVTVNIVEINMDSRSALDAPVTVPPLSLSGISNDFTAQLYRFSFPPAAVPSPHLCQYLLSTNFLRFVEFF